MYSFDVSLRALSYGIHCCFNLSGMKCDRLELVNCLLLIPPLSIDCTNVER